MYAGSLLGGAHDALPIAARRLTGLDDVVVAGAAAEVALEALRGSRPRRSPRRCSIRLTAAITMPGVQ